jgi:rRNA maturation protein Nop10
LNPNTGTISGTANQGGNFSFVVQVKKDGCAATKSYTLSVECPIISIEPSNLQDGLLGATYTQQLTQTGLVGAVTWQVSTGGLPNGLSLATNTGVISGTPTTLGTFNFVIRAASASMGCNTTKTYTINVPSACASITPSVIPSAHYCTPYSIKFGASGTDVVWSISTNIPGLTFANGILSGYPTGNNGQTGNYSFTVTRAQGDCTVSRSYTLKVICPAPGFISDPINGAGTRDVQQKK